MRRTSIEIRLEKLLAFIQANRPDKLEILSTLYGVNESGRRKFFRDLSALRAGGYEIEQDGEHRYFLRETGRSEAILSAILNENERRLLSRLRQEFGPGHPYSDGLQSLLDKLAGHVSRPQANAIPLTYFGPQFARDYSRQRLILEQLETAIRNKQRVRFIYTRPVSRELEEVPHLEVEPQFLEVRHGSLYLYGYHLARNRCYYYRLDKLKDLKLLPEKFGVFRQREVVEIEYLLDSSLVKGGISQRFYRQELLATLPDGRARLRAWDDPFWIKQELLRLGRKAELLSPPGLRAEIAAEIEDMYTIYHPTKKEAE